MSYEILYTIWSKTVEFCVISLSFTEFWERIIFQKVSLDDEISISFEQFYTWFIKKKKKHRKKGKKKEQHGDIILLYFYNHCNDYAFLDIKLSEPVNGKLHSETFIINCLRYNTSQMRLLAALFTLKHVGKT